MSQSPQVGEEPNQSYVDGWLATFDLVRRGKSWSGRERNCAFLNTGGERFADVSAVAGLDQQIDGRAMAVVDWDQDGALDLVTTSRSSPRVRLLHNRGVKGAHYVALRLHDQGGNPQAIGARVALRAGGHLQVRTLGAGDAFLSQSSKWISFGLGDATTIESLRVRWPDGSEEDVEPPSVDGRYDLERGAGRARPWTRPGDGVSLDAREPAPFETPPGGRLRLAAPLPLLPLDAQTLDGEPLEVAGGQRPLLVNLWASWCANCRKELADFAASAARLEGRVDILALTADEPEALPAARQVLRELEWPFRSGRASEEVLGFVRAVQELTLDRHEDLVLPTSLLVDARGHILDLYRGPVDVETLLAAAASSLQGPEEARERATPFPGRWLTPAFAPQVLHFVDALRNVGLVDLAARYASQTTLQPGAAGGRERLATVHYNLGVGYLREQRYDDARVAFERALEIEPEHAAANHNLGSILAREGRFEEAIPYYERAHVAAPEQTDVGRALAAALLRAGRSQEALAVCEALVETDPDDDRNWMQLGRTRLEAGDAQGARDALAELERLGSALATRLAARIDETH